MTNNRKCKTGDSWEDECDVCHPRKKTKECHECKGLGTVVVATEYGQKTGRKLCKSCHPTPMTEKECHICDLDSKCPEHNTEWIKLRLADYKKELAEAYKRGQDDQLEVERKIQAQS